MSKWDSEEWRKSRDMKLLEWFDGNEDAVRCYVDLSTVAEIWDDLIDNDSPVGDERVNRAFTIAMVTLPTNPFYIMNKHMLEPIVICAINAWMDSETLIGRVDDASRMSAFHLRNLGIELAPMIAFCIGGNSRMREVSLEIRDFMSHETYSEWEHRHAV